MKFFKGFKDGFKEFGETITSIVNFFLLLIVYIIGVGITSLIAKATKQKLLELNFKDGRKTYWIKHKEDVDFSKQF